MTRTLATLMGSLALCAASSAQFAIRDGDRVAFYGDSITDNGDYTTFIETFVLTRFPKWDIRFFNAGVGGDRVSGGLLGTIDERLKRDLLSRKPTLITVMLGMNDAGYREFVPELQDAYGKGYRHIMDTLRAERPNARVWLLKPSPYDDVTRPPTINGGYNSVLLRYGETVSQVAKEYGHWVADMNFPLADELYRAYAADPANSAKIIPDRVHPTPAGHLILAASLLKEWKAPTSPVNASINAATGTIQAQGTTISGVQTSTDLSWNQLDSVLPFPISWKDPITALVATTNPVVQEQFLGYRLRVTNLKPGNYVLKIDDQSVATVSAGDLAVGVDLAKLDTPMMQQAAEVHVLTVRRAYTMWSLWRNVEIGLEKLPSKERDDAIAAFRRLEDDLIRRQRAMAIPKSHRFVISPAQ